MCSFIGDYSFTCASPPALPPGASLPAIKSQNILGTTRISAFKDNHDVHTQLSSSWDSDKADDQQKGGAESPRLAEEELFTWQVSVL